MSANPKKHSAVRLGKVAGLGVLSTLLLLLPTARWAFVQEHRPPLAAGGAREAAPRTRGGSPAARFGEEESSEFPSQEQEFYDQRAYPRRFIPPHARDSAIRQLKEMERKERAQRMTSIASRAMNGNDDGVWRFIGPMPIHKPSGVVLNGCISTPLTVSGQVNAVAVDPTDANVVYIGANEGGVWKTTDGGSHWLPLFDEQDLLAIGSIALDPQDPRTVYVGTGQASGNFAFSGSYGNGVYKSRDGGASWKHLAGDIFGSPNSSSSHVDGFRIEALAVHPTAGNVLLAAASSSVVDQLPGSGVYRSTDGGNSWVLVLPGPPSHKVFFSPTDGNVAYALLNSRFFGTPDSPLNGVYKSSDAGKTWARLTITPGPGTDFRTMGTLAIAQDNPAILYTTVRQIRRDENGFFIVIIEDGLFKTDDGGQHWSQVTKPFLCCGGGILSCSDTDFNMAVDPVSSSIIFAGEESHMARSMDGGVTWSYDVDGGTIHPDHRALVFSSDGKKLYDGNDGGVSSTTDITSQTVTWSELNDTLGITQFYAGMSIDPNNLNLTYGGTQDNGTLKYTGTLRWELVLGGDGGYTGIDPNGPTSIYATVATPFSYGFDFEAHFAYRSDNGGASFHELNTHALSDAEPPAVFPPLIIDPINSERLYLGLRSIWQSTDRGDTWIAISPPLVDERTFLFVIAVAPSDSNTIYTGVTGDLGLQVTRDAVVGGLASWTDIRSPALPPRIVTAIGVDPIDPATAYVTFTGFSFGADMKGHVFKTTDAGANWCDISNNLPNIPVSAIAIDPEHHDSLYIGTDIGVFRTSNGGQKWHTMVQGLPRVTVVDLKFHRATRTLRAATHGRGMWDIAAPLTPNE